VKSTKPYFIPATAPATKEGIDRLRKEFHNAIRKSTMSSKKSSAKPFVIRGFDLTKESSFDTVGSMEKFSSFKEIVTEKQHNAIVEMSTNSTLHTLSTRNLIMTQPGQFPNKADDTKELSIIDLKLITNVDNVEDFRPYRTQLREVLKTWAEKSRVKGRRGWRLNAIKTPTIEYDPKADAVVVRTQVILSTAVFYNDTTATVNVNFNPNQERSDLESLMKALKEHADSNNWLTILKYKHSEIGDGEIV